MDSDIWDIRRSAHQHFHSRAANALNCSKLLYDAYIQSKSIAYWEGYLREASLSLELVIKSYVCLRDKSPPPASHNILKLWTNAGLTLERCDEWRIRHAMDILYWSGRYPAPQRSTQKSEHSTEQIRFGWSTVGNPTRENWTAMESLKAPEVGGFLWAQENISYDFDDIRRIFMIVQQEYFNEVSGSSLDKTD